MPVFYNVLNGVFHFQQVQEETRGQRSLQHMLKFQFGRRRPLWASPPSCIRWCAHLLCKQRRPGSCQTEIRDSAVFGSEEFAQEAKTRWQKLPGVVMTFHSIYLKTSTNTLDSSSPVWVNQYYESQLCNPVIQKLLDWLECHGTRSIDTGCLKSIGPITKWCKQKTKC